MKIDGFEGIHDGLPDKGITVQYDWMLGAPGVRVFRGAGHVTYVGAVIHVRVFECKGNERRYFQNSIPHGTRVPRGRRAPARARARAHRPPRRSPPRRSTKVTPPAAAGDGPAPPGPPARTRRLDYLHVALALVCVQAANANDGGAP